MHINYENPHTPLIRSLYGFIISGLHGLFFLGYLYLSYLIFKNNLPIVGMLHGTLEFFNLQSIEFLAWGFLTFFYLIIFVVLGTLSAFSSIEFSLSKLSNETESTAHLVNKKSKHVAINFYPKSFYTNHDSINFDESFGAHRIHSSYGFMVIQELRDLPEKTLANFWGLLHKPNFFQFVTSASISFIQPVDITFINRDIEDWKSGHIETKPGIQDFAHLKIMIDGFAVKKLEQCFNEDAELELNSGKFGQINLYGHMHQSSYLRVHSVDWHEIKRSSKQLADSICSSKFVPDKLKPLIQNAIVNTNSDQT